MINGIEYIGFAHAVFAYKTIYFGIELKAGVGKILVIK
jgi:hypothetical protein